MANNGVFWPAYSGHQARVENVGLVWLMENIRSLDQPTEAGRLQHNNGWQWRVAQVQWEGWGHQNYQWQKILAKLRRDFSQLNRRWRVNLTAEQWVSIWKRLCSSLTLHKDWILIWQVLNHGFFHNKRARTWGMNDGICPCCHNQVETIEHMFFECRFVRRRWATIAVCLMGSRLAPPFTKGTLGEIIYARIWQAKRNPVPLVIIVEMVASIWRERNTISFRGDRSQIPISHLLRVAEDHGRALMMTSESERKRRMWERDLATLHEAANLPLYNTR